MKKVFLYTDGGARGNPGPAATGVVFKDAKGTVIKTATKFLGKATNNQAEYEALVQGLTQAAKSYATAELQVYMDSELIIKQMRGEYRVRDAQLAVLHSQAIQLVTKLSKVSFAHIPRAKNFEADALVNQTLDRQ